MESFLNKVKLCRKKIVMIMFLNFSDWVCTTTLLNNEGFFEVNPIMAQIMDKPLLCFCIKCILPFILSLYIYKVLPNSNELVVSVVNIIMIIISLFYIAINIVHIFNLFLLILF
jgi:hypothetical protein